MARNSKSFPTEENNASVLPQLKEAEVAYATSPQLRVASDTPTLSFFLGKQAISSSNEISNKQHFISIIREGVKMKALEHFMEATEITPSEIASIMHTSERTFRRYNSDTSLNPEQSERLIELARLYTRGSEVFGLLDNFKRWMNTEIVALGNRKPSEFLDTSLGIEILQEELGKIEHGVFA